jgi:hypothetical protein
VQEVTVEAIPLASQTFRGSSSKIALPLERIIVLDSKKAVEARWVIRFVLRIPNISESVIKVQLVAPVVIISLKPVVAIAIVLKGLESVMMLVRGNMEIDSPVHRANWYSHKRIYKTVPTERLGNTDPRC